MVTTGGGRDAGADAGRHGQRRRWVPGVGGLEDRTLQAQILPVVFLRPTVLVHPALLPPSRSGVALPVTVTGQVLDQRPGETPVGFFHVTDEYRRYEPFGVLKFTPAGKFASTNFSLFKFQLQLNLPTNRSTSTPDGRHYDISLGAIGHDNTDSLTKAVYVPKVFPRSLHVQGKPTVGGPLALTRPHRKA
jgi:hypothetical protein